VRALLGSPPAFGKFQGGIAMSNLGGGVDLGLSGDYSTTYSSYLTIPESYALAGQALFLEAGCNQTSLPAQISCLKQVSAATIVDLPTNARYVVQDGHYINTPELDVANRNSSTAHVPVIFGNTANDGASFCSFPPTDITTLSEGIQASLSITPYFADLIINSKLFPYYDTGNLTLDSFNVSQRVSTDKQFRCIDQATMYAGVSSSAFPTAYYYQMDRTGAGYDPNHVGGPPVEPGYPYGDPNLPYFRLHGSDMPWVFGNLDPLRDADDLWSIQLTTAYFGAFVKTGNPNPSEEYLLNRGYGVALEGVRRSGEWVNVRGADGPMQLLDWPSRESVFLEPEQCSFLNYSISYYLEKGH